MQVSCIPFSINRKLAQANRNAIQGTGLTGSDTVIGTPCKAFFEKKKLCQNLRLIRIIEIR